MTNGKRITYRIPLLFLLLCIPSTYVQAQCSMPWTKLYPASSPYPRSSHAMAYYYFDATYKGVLLFGGHQFSLFSDTWKWDGNNWQQVPLSSPPNHPCARRGHDMVFAASSRFRKSVVLFGGSCGIPQLRSDTWEWDPKTERWTELKPASSPPARYYHAMAYDQSRDRVVVFGGVSGAPPWPQSMLNDTWEWDGRKWTLRNTSSSPQARHGHRMVFDSNRKVVVLFGGADNTQLFSDTWEWDGNNWTQRFPARSPLGRERPEIAYDPIDRRVILFGGEVNQSTWPSETWDWDGINWSKRNPNQAPQGLSRHAMVYDVARSRIVLFGGHNSYGVSFSETWEYGPTIMGDKTTVPLGRTVTFTLNAGMCDASLTYQVASSFGTGPIQIDTRQIDLSPDSLLWMSLSGLFPSIFQNYSGTISSQGTASAAISIPNSPTYIGLNIYSAFVTLSSSAPSGIKSISNTETFMVTK